MDPVVVSAVAQPGQISLWHLIMQSSWPVFLVMVGLALASVWCWAIIIEKYFAVRRINAANDRFLTMQPGHNPARQVVAVHGLAVGMVRGGLDVHDGRGSPSSRSLQ